MVSEKDMGGCCHMHVDDEEDTVVTVGDELERRLAGDEDGCCHDHEEGEEG